jgi:hypothetical protein
MREYVTVVTGAPRSGTSLMMRMLDAGGIPALTDGHRPPDEHNPGGYFEYDPVKRLAENSSWLETARGRAVKVIYRLLPYLPPQVEYRVVFMERDLTEVFESQRAMLRARGDPAADQQGDRLLRALAEELDNARELLAGRWCASRRRGRARLRPFSAAAWMRLPWPRLSILSCTATGTRAGIGSTHKVKNLMILRETG